MTSLTAIFGNSADKADDNESESDKLLHLYWNRAELKKEFAELRAEKLRLLDLVKEKDGAAARLQQKLENLENLLLDPEWVYNVVTYFQLRSLNLRCQAKLTKFAEELKQQREQKQHGQLLAAWQAQQDQMAAAIQREIGEKHLAVQILDDRLQAERHRMATMGHLTKLFRGRSVMASLDAVAAEIEAGQQDEQILLQRLKAVQTAEPPDTQGLNVAAKRMINFMILAFAQQLYLHFQKGDVANLAKEAADRSVGAINYGSKESCDAILQKVRQRIDALESAIEFANVLRRRAKLIADAARFSSDDDAVPTLASVSTVFAFDAQGNVGQQEVNLLADNYWELECILSR